MVGDIFYRIENERWAAYEEVLKICEFIAMRETRCGHWVMPKDGSISDRMRFVLNGDGRRYAYPSLEAAVASFKIRKRRQIEHLERQLTSARTALDLVEDGNYIVPRLLRITSAVQRTASLFTTTLTNLQWEADMLAMAGAMREEFAIATVPKQQTLFGE